MSDKKQRINIHEYLAEFDDIPGTRVFTAKLPLLGNVKVNDVTLAITYRQGSARTSQIAEFDSLWVSHRGRWVRIYAPADYQAYKSGRCP